MGEQRRIFRTLPGLANAEFVRYGMLHRNTYLNGPAHLDRFFRWKKDRRVFFAGQITGVEGYLESAATGLMAGATLAQLLEGREPVPLPFSTALGALSRHVSESDEAGYAPMNVTFGLIDDSDVPPIRDRRSAGRRSPAARSSRSPPGAARRCFPRPREGAGARLAAIRRKPIRRAEPPASRVTRARAPSAGVRRGRGAAVKAREADPDPHEVHARSTGMKPALTLPALALLALPLGAQEPPKRSAVWEANCTVCHGDDGRARTEEGLKKRARNFTDPKWQESVSDGRLTSSIKRGHDQMPAFGRKLTEEQVKALVAEIRSFATKGS